MRRLLVLALVALLPRAAQAATCLSVAPTGQPPFAALVVDYKAVGGFFYVVGEFINLPAPDPTCPSYLVSGSAHLRPDGKVHFGLETHETSALDFGCDPIILEGTLDPPSYTSGTGVGTDIDSGGAGVVTVTLSATSCPPLPQRARRE